MIPDESNLLDQFADLCDGTLDDAGFARLQSRLESDVSARRLYIQYMQLHAELAFSDGALHAMGSQVMMEDAAALVTSPSIPQPAEVWPDRQPLPTERNILFRIGAGIAAAAVLLAAGIYFLGDPAADPTSVATITPAASARFDTTFAAGDDLTAGRVLHLAAGSATVDFHAGSQVTLNGQTHLRLDSPSAATLITGAVSAHVPPRAVGFTVDAPNLRVVDLGTRFGVLVPPRGDTEVHVFEGRVEVHPRIRLPRLYYPFDDAGSATSNPFSAVPNTGIIEGSAKRTKGIVGAAAIDLDNRPHACVRIATDGDPAQRGQGVFGDLREGLTIEALIIPRFVPSGWSVRGAKPYDYDEIFRKEDDVYRILLCFQDDTGAEQPIIPIVDPGPCLSFGIHLEGLGYSELDMPLDGQQGRPTLADLKDGKPHHIVATYDAATGIKAIYIDGTLRFRHRFPAGTRVIAGGPAVATIGNHYRFTDEAFSGIIDEFAFYGSALAALEVAGHWRSVQAGRNYFGVTQLGHSATGPTAKLPLSAGQAMRFDMSTGLPSGDLTPSDKPFGK